MWEWHIQKIGSLSFSDFTEEKLRKNYTHKSHIYTVVLKNL